MTLSELWPTLQILSRAEKLRLIRSLADDLAQEEDAPLLVPGTAYPVWSQIDAHEAAAALLRFLEESES